MLIAVIVAGDGQSPTTATIRSFLAERLPHYMVPNRVLIVDELPLGPSGKLDRHRAAAIAQAQVQVDR
jgi:mycobactin peptide synthetase MbtF